VGDIFILGIFPSSCCMSDAENNTSDELRCDALLETDEEFERKMERGYADAIEGRGKPMEDVFSDLSKRFI
jgi:hypothetical protein